MKINIFQKRVLAQWQKLYTVFCHPTPPPISKNRLHLLTIMLVSFMFEATKFLIKQNSQKSTQNGSSNDLNPFSKICLVLNCDLNLKIIVQFQKIIKPYISYNPFIHSYIQQLIFYTLFPWDHYTHFTFYSLFEVQVLRFT